MLTVKRKTDHALVALARLAQEPEQTKAGSVPPPISCRQIAEEFDLPLQQLMGILKELQRAGVVRSTRGPRGGYHLSAPANQIPLTRVIEAIEGPVKLTMCCDETDAEACQSCELVPKCPISKRIRVINEQVYQFLGRFTVADLVSEDIQSQGSKSTPLTQSAACNSGTAATSMDDVTNDPAEHRTDDSLELQTVGEESH